ncbi:MAG: carboxy terminal-processing peptidase [Bacteroidetes bacterium]|nr:carboxy terminal-processing peptidase [Bacteroidota bacterium]
MFILFFLFVQVNNSFSQDLNSCNHINMTAAMLDKFHFSPPAKTSDNTQKIHFSFYEYLDNDQICFTLDEVKKLCAESSSCDFFTKVTELYKKRILHNDSLVDVYTAKAFDFSVAESISFEEKPTFSKALNQKELDERFRKLLKLATLSQMFKSVDDSVRYKLDNKVYLAKEAESRAEVKKNFHEFKERMLNHPSGYEQYMLSLFLNVLAESYDPHSSHFTPGQKERFEKALSKESYSFGFGLDENSEGEVSIAYLTPGGAAWKNGQIHKGDVLLKMTLNKKEYDVSKKTVNQVSDILNSVNANSITLTFRKSTGLEESVTLEKQKIEVEENLITGVILNGTKRIGYISLPGFYTEFGQQNALGCANDMAKEILKLQKDGIDGLILDLRFNGGGAVEEALELAGIFINEGPLMIEKTSGQKPKTLIDKNRGTIYNGPLIVMVNGSSASASEIVAAALQDYNRALIVGSTTYGKATAQIVLPVDTNISFTTAPRVVNKDYGFVKVTISKVYRVKKNSHQNTGVKPDVVLPEVLESSQDKEASYSNALPSDNVVKEIYNFTPLAPLPATSIAGKSTARVAVNKAFVNVVKLNQSYKVLSDQFQKSIPLNITEYKALKQKMDAVTDQLDTLVPPAITYQVENTTYDKTIIQADEHKKTVNEKTLKNISDDIYIDETYKIMQDLIENK